MSFPVGSFGLEEGRGGGTRAPAVSGVVGLFGTGTTETEVFTGERQVQQLGNPRTQTNSFTHVANMLHRVKAKILMQQDLWYGNRNSKTCFQRLKQERTIAQQRKENHVANQAVS